MQHSGGGSSGKSKGARAERKDEGTLGGIKKMMEEKQREWGCEGKPEGGPERGCRGDKEKLGAG